jgi:putative endonuclease
VRPDLTARVRRSTGACAEQVVAAFLEREGFRILGRNVRVGRLEVDLLAQRGEVVALVEVRYRGPGSWKGPFASVTEAKRARLRAAARRLWADRFARDRSVERMRYDVAAVWFEPEGETRVEYVAAAFQ